MPIAQGDLVEIPAGLLDDDPAVRPAHQMWTSQHAPWWTPDPSLAGHAQGPPAAARAKLVRGLQGG